MIGLLGLGSHSTIHYINRLNEFVNKQSGGYSTCEMKIYNADFDKINPHLPDDYAKFQPYLEKTLKGLNKLKVDKILVPNITLHEGLDKMRLPKKISKKIIHPYHNKVLDRKKLKYEDSIIIGSYYTMKSEYIRKAISNNFNNLTWSEVDSSIYDSIEKLRNKVFKKGVSPKSVSEYKSAVEAIGKKNIFIACTEISLLNNALDKKRNIDLVESQIKSALIH